MSSTKASGRSRGYLRRVRATWTGYADGGGAAVERRPQDPSSIHRPPAFQRAPRRPPPRSVGGVAERDERNEKAEIVIELVAVGVDGVVADRPLAGRHLPQD